MGGLPPKPPIGGRVASPKPPAKCPSIYPLGFGKTHLVRALAMIRDNKKNMGFGGRPPAKVFCLDVRKFQAIDLCSGLTTKFKLINTCLEVVTKLLWSLELPRYVGDRFPLLGAGYAQRL